MSSLRPFQSNPKNLINTAMHMFRSKNIRTAIVEGVCDRRFLSQWSSGGKPLRFDGFNGKTVVNDVYELSRTKPFSQYAFLMFFADIDYDFIHQTPLKNSSGFIYNAYCSEKKTVLFNDLEGFLVNTSALEKVLANLDFDPIDANIIRQKLERASREVGALRAADELVRKKLGKSRSILNSIEPSAFYDARKIEINSEQMIKMLPNWSNYKEHVDDLVEHAKLLNANHPTPWALSRGHDVTELLSLHLAEKGAKGMTGEKIELFLRLACEEHAYKNSPMGKRIMQVDTDGAFFRQPFWG